ncbi:MAG: hypothetical protein RI964_2678 [Pseudomonadota bacterium]
MLIKSRLCTWLMVASLSSLSSLLVACQSSESKLTQAAEQRWIALINGNFTEAYQYYTDAFQQSTPLEMFKHKVHGTGLWNKAAVKSVQCDDSGKHCTVEVEVTVAMKMRGLNKPLETKDVVKETWVKAGWFSDWRYIKE